MSTIHNPSNFVPEHYAVVDYLDNRFDVSEFIGADSAALIAMRKEWEASFAIYYGMRGNEFPVIPHNCDHCGANIRYVVVAQHAPSGEYIAMGEICAERVNLSLDQHRIKNLKDVAKKRRDTARLGSKRARFLEHNPSAAQAFSLAHENDLWNDFMESLDDQLYRKGELSEKQVSALVRCVDKMIVSKKARIEQEKTAADAIPGRHDIIGKVVSTKVVCNDYGQTTKMLVVQQDGAKYWGSVPVAAWDNAPSDDGTLLNSVVSFKGTCEVSKDDSHFAFFKRPASFKYLS